MTGFLLILAGAGLVAAGEATARGWIGPNPLIGIRVGYVTHSPEAWQTGHRAARTFVAAAGAVMAAGGVAVLAAPLSEPAGSAVAVGACLATLALIIAGAVKANRAAARTVVQSVDAGGNP